MVKTIGSRAEVMHKTALRTAGGLTIGQLKYNPTGKIVSKKASEGAAGRYCCKVQDWAAATTEYMSSHPKAKGFPKKGSAGYRIIKSAVNKPSVAGNNSEMVAMFGIHAKKVAAKMRASGKSADCYSKKTGLLLQKCK